MANYQPAARLTFFVLLTLCIASCGEKKPEPSTEQLATHQADVQTWYDGRLQDLKSHDGFLNLAGLYWLKDGINSFGSDESNDVVFPAGMIAGKAGYYVVKGTTVSLIPAVNSELSVYGTPVLKEINAFHPDSVRAVKALAGSVTNHGTLEWYVIRRDDKMGIRLRNLESEAVKNFPGIERYPVDYSWKVEAKFDAAPEGKTIDITNVLGQTTPQESLGAYVFTIGGKEYRLDTTGKGKQLFVVFADSTTGHETYPAGRFIYIDRPDSTGRAWIDFNKSYNPPCAFTEFATCPLPTRENTLSIAIRAGEKNFDLKKLSE